ncbi:MAG: MFS transporter [Streptosporangiales bacterium]|nr:MFS transporter [Streptosporangiales bacterium]
MVRRVAGASLIGTALEWYDYFLYGTAAALVFETLFFPGFAPGVGILVAFLSFAVGFVARPIGAIAFGHLGDRHGRRLALMVTVLVMGLATGLIGLLPVYESVGIAAPIALSLLRFAQGFSVGGEWSGAVLLALEYAPADKRPFYASIPQLGSPLGTLVSSGAFIAVTQLPEDALLSWGWRLPFVFAFVLLGVAVYLRVRIEESPLFKQMLEEERAQRVPLFTALRFSPGRMVLCAAGSLLGIGGFFLLTTFILSYGTETLGLSRSTMLLATQLGAVAEIAIIMYFGRLANRWGAWKVSAFGSAVTLVLAFPIFLLIGTSSAALVIVGVTVGIAALSIPYAPTGAMLAELFPSEVRYSAVALSYNIAGIVGGFVPAIAQVFLGFSDNQVWGPALLLALIAATNLAGALGISVVRKRKRYV